MKYVKLVQLALLFFFSSTCFAQWNTYFDLITERDSFPDIGEMSFINPQTGVATSELPPILGNQNFRGGTLILTSDSGRTWSTQIVEDSIAFTDVKYLDSNLIIATGAEVFRDTTLAKQGAIARSLDGGLTWSINYFLMKLSNIVVLNDSTIMVAANDAKNPNKYSNFMISSNHGVSWTVLPSNYPNEEITDLLFLNDSIGFSSSASGRILKTVNQGISWDSLPLTWSNRTSIMNLSSPDSVNLFCSTLSAAFHEVYYSSDLGTTWSSIGQFVNVQIILKAEFITDSIGFYFGNSRIWKTYDQGVTWVFTRVNGTSRIPFSTSIQFFDENLIYLGGNYSFLRTFNGGDSTLLTGVTENNSIAGQYMLYPNPTKGIVNIPHVEDLDRVEVYNIAGKLLQNFVDFDSAQSDRSNESVNKINLSNYEAGIYFLKLIMKNGEVFTKKVVKEQ